MGRKYGITINTVAPGPVPTDSLLPRPVRDTIHAGLVPMTQAEERMGTVEDIIDAVLLIASSRPGGLQGSSSLSVAVSLGLDECYMDLCSMLLHRKDL